jgi:phage/plasmid primase-like uncharacterized protein
MNAAELADRLGLARSGRSWRGACPACGYPRAFTLRAGKADAALTYCANGCDRAELRAVVEGIAGGRAAAPIADAPAPSTRRRDAALRLWAGSDPARGTLAETYLAARALPGLTASAALRFRNDTPHPEGGSLPAMLALVADAAGEPIGLHRTYLARDGSGKATVEPAKASLGPVWGGAIRLNAPAGAVALVIGEGIETTASAGLMIGLPAWAAISAGNMARGLILPPVVRRVVIAVDPDPPGEAAAATAADRWQRAGLHVQLARPTEGADFNDTLRARRRSAADA